jgi:rhamnulokinase
VPGEGKGWAYLSSGTWSLLGIEAKKPIITDASREANFTNEVGYGHSIRFLKNIVGLWILQECRREWAAAGKEYDYATLAKLAGEAAPLQALINPNADRFLKPGDMPGKIAAYCRETGQQPPATHGATARCILESLALLYAKTIADMNAIAGQQIKRLHIVGGGSKNELLNQFAANATGLPVIAGPVEGTAIGNILIQALALGHLADLAALRQVVRDSFPVTKYAPQSDPAWQTAGQRLTKLTLAS